MAPLLRPLMEVDGRDAADVITAILVDWLGTAITTRTLRVIAEEVVTGLIESDFIAVPIENLIPVGRWLDDQMLSSDNRGSS